MTDEQKSILKVYEDELSAARAKVRDLEKTIRDIHLANAGVAVGDIVTSRRWGLCRVSHVDASWGLSKPWLRGNPKKKDGTWGTAERNLYSDWTK